MTAQPQNIHSTFDRILPREAKEKLLGQRGLVHMDDGSQRLWQDHHCGCIGANPS
jgi:hypothetical protein